MKYEAVLENKYLFDGCKTIEEMVDACVGFSQYLTDLKNDGIELVEDVESGFVFLGTDNPDIAAKYEFEIREDDETY